MTHPTTDRHNQRLTDIHDRMAWIARTEARAVLIGGHGSSGEFDPERQRLIEETDRLLDEPCHT